MAAGVDPVRWGGDAAGITRTGIVARVLPDETVDVTENGTSRRVSGCRPTNSRAC